MGRCYVVGIDGGSWRYINHFLYELPNIRLIIQNGASGPLKSTIPPLTASAWTSYLTGVNPGKHGIFDFFRKEGYSIKFLTSKDKKVPGIEQILSVHGKRVGIINVPLTYPPYKVNGIMYSGFPMPEERMNHTYPKDLLKELYAELGNLRTQPRVFYSKYTAEDFINDILFTHKSLIKISDYILSNYDFDFYTVVFGATDALSHAFWSCIWGSHPLHSPSECKRFSSILLKVYKSIDSYIGKIIKYMDDDDLLIVMSDHGFGELKYTVFINNWLRSLGLLNFKDSLFTRIKLLLYSIGLTPKNIYKIVNRLRIHSYIIRNQFVGEFDRKLLNLTKIKELILLDFKDIDWKRTKAFAMGTFGQIYINLRGREPKGIVNPGAEYEQIVDFIIDDLKNLRNPLTGKKMFDLVYRKEDIYSGEYLKYAPDIIFLDSTCTHITNRGFEFGSKKLLTPHVLSWTGTHSLYDGILLMYGRGVIKNCYFLNNAKIIDIAPTILHYFDIPIPLYADGRPLIEVFEDNSQFAKRVPRYSNLHSLKFKIKSIRERLRDRLCKK